MRCVAFGLRNAPLCLFFAAEVLPQRGVAPRAHSRASRRAATRRPPGSIMEPSRSPPGPAFGRSYRAMGGGRHHLFLFGLHNAPFCPCPFLRRRSTATTGVAPRAHSRASRRAATRRPPGSIMEPSRSPPGAAFGRSYREIGGGGPPPLFFWAPHWPLGLTFRRGPAGVSGPR